MSSAADQRWEDPAYRKRIGDLAEQVFKDAPGLTLGDLEFYKAHLATERLCGLMDGELTEDDFEDAMRRADAYEARLRA